LVINKHGGVAAIKISDLRLVFCSRRNQAYKRVTW